MGRRRQGMSGACASKLASGAYWNGKTILIQQTETNFISTNNGFLFGGGTVQRLIVINQPPMGSRRTGSALITMSLEVFFRLEANQITETTGTFSKSCGFDRVSLQKVEGQSNCPCWILKGCTNASIGGKASMYTDDFYVSGMTSNGVDNNVTIPFICVKKFNEMRFDIKQVHLQLVKLTIF